MSGTLVKTTESAICTVRPCVVCAHSRARSIYRYFYGDRQFSEILQCLNCGHMFIHPVPLAALSDRNMDTLSDAEFFGNEWMKGLHERLVINREIRWLKKFLASGRTPRLLDIGCGTGWTTSLFQKNGFETVGLEPSPVRSKAARQMYHLNVCSDHLENFKTQELFDVVVMRHLLEHIEDPAAMLVKVKTFLNPGGILLIVIPNINCIGRYLFRANWEWVLPWHLHFYTPRTLSRLLAKSGFEKLKVYQTPSPLWYPHTLNKALFGPDPKFKFPHALAATLSLLIVLIGMLLNLNDNMTLIFRKSSSS